MSSLTQTEAAHLARRTGFAANPSQVELLLNAATKEQAITLLLEQEPSLIPVPEWSEITRLAPASEEEIILAQQQRKQMSKELKHWWLAQMLKNSAPLHEKMVLFWHNHFTSSLKKVMWPLALLQQNLLFREHALASFRDLLRGILQDPAMLKYLDNANSRKEAPNENLSRELLELFTLGEGNYVEQDVKELAKALTGASIDRKTGLYKFRPAFHAAGDKTIFNETAAFFPEDVADLILRQPQIAPFIVKKLWREFINDEPIEASVVKISDAFIQSDFQIAQVISLLLLEDAFWQSAGEKIKSPIELVVGSFHLFDVSTEHYGHLNRLSRQMGQDLFDPPNVKGWPGGNAWYHSGTIAPRALFVEQFSRLINAEFTLDQSLLLANAPVGELPDVTHADYLIDVLTNPTYQVC